MKRIFGWDWMDGWGDRAVGWSTFLVLVLGTVVTASSGTIREQSISLEKGWNAVFLEVEPSEANPDKLFAETPIDIVAGYFPRSSSAQFMKDPGADLFRAAGWGVWYSQDRPDSFLKSLHLLEGRQAYLIHAVKAFRWKIAGRVQRRRTRWESDDYSLVGFSVSAVAPPTFGQFFSGSEAHQPLRIYRLVGGTWRHVEEPYRVPMRSGEAFWIYCRGGSDYQGPLRVKTTVRQGLYLGNGPGRLVLENDADYPVAVTVAHVAEGAAPVPLSIVVRAVREDAFAVESLSARKPQGGWSQAIPVMEGGSRVGVPFEARLEAMDQAVHKSLLRIETDVGTEAWVPVVAVRSDLQED